jgi:VanZ family protein
VSLAYYLGVITVLSHLPGPVIADLEFDVWDKAAHFLVYFPIGIGLWLFVRGEPRLSRPSATIALALLCGALLGALDELHQSFVPGRFCSFSDVVADILGVTFGALSARQLGILVSRWRSETT